VLLLAFTHHITTVESKSQDPPKDDPAFETVVKPFFAKNCFACHDEDLQTANLNLGGFKTASSLIQQRATMKLILDKVQSGQMPPAKMPKPKPEEVTALSSWLTHQLAQMPEKIAANPEANSANSNSGRVTLRRLNRVEYNNTIRDLVGVDRHLADDFPQDDSGYGFDNIGDVLSLSPVLMEKYLAAAEKISRTAIFGVEPIKPTLVRLRSGERTFTPQSAPLTDYDQSGLSLPNAVHTIYRFPVDGEYVIRANLGGDRPAGSEAFQLALWIDGEQKQTIRVDPGNLASFAQLGEPQQLWGIRPEFRVTVPEGEHWIGVAIPRLYEGLPPSYNGPNPSKLPIPPWPRYKPPPDLTPKEIEERRLEHEKKGLEKIPANSPRVGFLELGGPYASMKGPSAESKKKIYVCKHLNGEHNDKCARLIIERLAHRAYRRAVTKDEIQTLTTLYTNVKTETGSFEEGLAVAIQAILMSPNFLFRVEKLPGSTALAASKLSQHELASRLSYFLWSSMPDDELLLAADRGRLAKPAVLDAQVRRMLLDPKAQALVENFGGQWLQVRKLESVKPDGKRFPDFDEYLRLSMARETQAFFSSIIREDRSILDFIDADYSFLNERLARFYNIPNITGPEFRRVSFNPDSHRGGLLTQASVLTISSYANRTSPVLRGKWVLENLVGAPPPPPPPDVPNLDEAKIGKTSSMREQLEQHRKNAICASCHSRMDPLGFGLENFDAVGAWRTKDGEFTIDSSGTLPDGTSFSGPTGLKAILKQKPDAFAECLTRKLMIYALGRGLEPADEGTVKEIVKNLSANDYRFSSMIMGIVESQAFQRRRGEKVQ
jgi:hypothetical protein